MWVIKRHFEFSLSSRSAYFSFTVCQPQLVNINSEYICSYFLKNDSFFILSIRNWIKYSMVLNNQWSFSCRLIHALTDIIRARYICMMESGEHVHEFCSFRRKKFDLSVETVSKFTIIWFWANLKPVTAFLISYISRIELTQSGWVVFRIS